MLFAKRDETEINLNLWNRSMMRQHEIEPADVTKVSSASKRVSTQKEREEKKCCSNGEICKFWSSEKAKPKKRWKERSEKK